MPEVAQPPAESKSLYDWRLAGLAVYTAIMRGESEILIYGGRGTGKTIFICDLCYRMGMKHPGMTLRWGRKFREDMNETVLKTFEEEVLPGYPGISYEGPTRENRQGYQLASGSTINLHGLRDIEKTKSMRADLWWINEAGELAEGHWEDIGSTSRAHKYDVCPFQVKLADINPMPPAHWTNKRCAPVPDDLYPTAVYDKDGQFERLHFPPEQYAKVMAYNLQPLGNYKTRKILFFHVENPGYWNDQTYDFHPNGFKYLKTKLATQSGSRRLRALESRPAAEEDVVFPEFSRRRHVIEPFAWPRKWPVFVAYDPGFRHPCAVDYVGIAPNGQPYFVDEIAGPGITIDELGAAIREKNKQYWIYRMLADPKGADQASQIGNGITAMQYMLKNFGLYFEPWKAKRGKVVQDHVELLRLWLTAAEPLQVFDTCPGIISNFENWMNKQTKDGELPEGDERYVDSNNDGLDGLIGIRAEDPKFIRSADLRIRVTE